MYAASIFHACFRGLHFLLLRKRVSEPPMLHVYPAPRITFYAYEPKQLSPADSIGSLALGMLRKF